MSSPTGLASLSTARDLLTTAWPPVERGDSELQRRRKFAVRGGQIAMMVLVGAAVVATFAPHAEQASAWRIFALSITGMAYIMWSLHGMRRPVRELLWGQAASDTAAHGWRLAIYFGIQLALAQAMYGLGDRGRVTAVMWLVLLPPVAHSVILLGRRGTALVCAVAVAMFVGNMLRWYPWHLVQNAALAFSFSVLFTVVFTSLAVTAEQSRDQVQRLATELTEANRQLRQYAVQVEELAATRERNRLAREIHDSLGHYLTVVNVHLEAARALAAQNPTASLDALHKAQAFTQQGLQEIRRSVASLRASPLDSRTLAQALRELAAESSAAGLDAQFEVAGRERALAPAAQLALFRAAQEAVTNIRKHAQARRAWLKLDFSSPGTVRLEVRDDGVGAARTDGGFGLLGLRERVALLNGRCEVQTAPGAGFAIQVELPA
jgi:signal transduction histidine kinase